MSSPEQARAYTADPKEVLRFQQHRVITVLFRSFLIALEDLGLAHDEALAKLEAALPEQYRVYIDLADYLTPERSKQLRKKVLDAGGEADRTLEELLNSFDIHFKT